MNKTLTLLVFEIEASQPTTTDLNLPRRLHAALEASPSIEDRAMVLNSLDIKKESDFIATYHHTKTTLFGCVIRMKQGDATHIMKDQLSKKVIDIAELVAESEEGVEGFIKDTTYFLMDRKHIILKSGHVSKKAVQTYMNWLINKPDGNEEICRFQPKLSKRESVALSSVRSVEISESHFVGFPAFKTISRNIDTMKSTLLRELVADAPDLETLVDENLVSASIQLRFHIRKTKKEEDCSDIMKALLNSTDSDDIKISLKGGGVITGSTFKEKKSVEIELTEQAFLNERELESTMATYLRELG